MTGLLNGKCYLIQILPNLRKKFCLLIVVLSLDGIAINPVSDHKHLGLILDSKLTFNKHIDEKISIGVIRRLYHYLPRKSIIQIYKSFIRPHLDCCDIIYHKPLHDIFSSEYYFERASSDPS